MQTSAPILLLQQTSYANDPLLSCAIMLEMLDVLMQSDRPFRHNLIFLFNGAEENLLPVSFYCLLSIEQVTSRSSRNMIMDITLVTIF